MSGRFRFISAGAGSGKTYRLADLLHEMLLDGRVRPSGVIATTFTNKAAAELRERVRSHLIQKGQFRLATAIGESRIGTVNSVCGNLVARFAFEAGLSTEQRVLDEGRAGQILDEAIDEVIEGPTLTQLLRIVRRLSLDRPGFGQEKIPWQETLRSLVSQARSNAIEPERLRSFGPMNAESLLGFLPKAKKRDYEGALKAAIAAALPPVREAATRGGKKNTGEYLQFLERAERDLRSGDLTWSQWNGLATKAPEAALRPVIEPVQEAAAPHTSDPRFHQDIRDYLSMIFALAADVLDQYRKRKSELGAIDFTDQERELLNIIDKPEVAETLRAELDLLMVDEFQDTSPIQLALFLKLGQLAKQVVWVGDVKQAIYGFRGGDDALMTAVLDHLPDLNGEKEVLPNSWRSRPSLVGFVNELFGAAFPKLASPDVVLTAKRPEFTGTAALEDWILEGNVAEQHLGIAAGIETLVREGTRTADVVSGELRPVRFGDIAILARSNNAVKAVAQALRESHIPVSTAQPGLLAQPEVVLALACIRRLNDEHDTIATAEIVSLATCEDPDSWLADRLAWLDAENKPSDWKEAGDELHPIFQAIRQVRDQRPVLSPREAVEIVVARCGVSRHVLQWQQSSEQARARLANLDQLVTFAADYEDECRSSYGVATLSGFLLWLEELRSDELDQLAQTAVDAVRVMTHHAAKGLEWPVVVLMDLAGDVKDSIWNSVRAEALSPFDVRSPLNDRFLRHWPWPYGAQGGKDLKEVVGASAAGQQILAAAVEEHKRVLYVSLTRARDVVVVARATKKRDGDWMGTIGLAGQLPVEDQAALTLSGGEELVFKRRQPTTVAATAETSTLTADLRWFETGLPGTPKLPLTVSPSAIEGSSGKVAEVIPVGSRIAVRHAPDMAAFGNAMHACLAVHLASPEVPFDEAAAAGIVDRMDVLGSVAAADVATQVQAVGKWIVDRWPGAEAYVEVPVTEIHANGQRLMGRIDLLLRTRVGWILLDHKSSPKGAGHVEDLAEAYGAQLAAYGAAVAAVTGVPVVESWIVLPVAGVAVRVQAQ